MTIEMRDRLNYERGVSQGIEQGIERGIEQNQRSVILKVYQKGYPIEEIADLAGCDEATVLAVINSI